MDTRTPSPVSSATGGGRGPEEFDFHRLERLPPYVFTEVTELMLAARRAGRDVVDLGMGNPDLPTPKHVVDKIREVSQNTRTHRYSSSRGIPNLRAAICEWYARHHGVALDPGRESIALIGSKEGLAHFVLMTVGPGDAVMCPDPGYPIHQYSVAIAGGTLHTLPLADGGEFLSNLERAIPKLRPKLVILSFPHNPTTCVAPEEFFERIVAVARRHEVMLLHDFAYAELAFDGYHPPSLLQVPGARDIAIEFTSLSKSHSMAGWRVGFACGNPSMIGALARMKSYLDYGIPTPIQVGAIEALRGPQACVADHVAIYRGRRDRLVDGLGKPGRGRWHIEKPRATMFVWAPIPESHRHLGSLAFSKLLLEKANVAVSPGVGFGRSGEGYVRFSLVENEHRIRQAVGNVRRALAA
ncbi:MAG TPA: aminotransferase class I/II-fold pyridoxal phosphate-dependent enzyme [Woeseiaceae bacterium]|nr:aminotransferase class I/II-fold pyridoxal phosphate-dependent enzyme [Woeseiaceae bacterium]